MYGVRTVVLLKLNTVKKEDSLYFLNLNNPLKKKHFNKISNCFKNHIITVDSRPDAIGT